MPDELLLDLSSPLPVLVPEDIRAWASGRQVFISSTMADLKQERESASAAVSSMGLTPRYFEAFSSSGDPANAFVPEVSRAYAVVLILGERYGKPLPDARGRSATHLEYDTARTALRPVLVFRKEGVEREPALASFLEQLDGDHVVARFRSPEQLRDLITEGLTRLAHSDSIEWARLGSAVFPVARISRTSNSFELATTTQNARLVRYLQGLTRPHYQRLDLVLGNETFEVTRVGFREERRGRYQTDRIIDIEVDYDFSGNARRPELHYMTGMSVNGRSPAEWCKAYVRAMLFDTPMPENFLTGYRGAPPQRPPFHLPQIYEDLKGLNRVDELFTSLGRLYLVDRLLRGAGDEKGVTDTIYRVDLAPAYGGFSKVQIEYGIPSQFSARTETDFVEGDVALDLPNPQRGVRDWR